MIRFIRERDKDYPGVEISLTISSDSDITAAVEAFEDFLRACGYPLEKNEHLDIVEK
jgi:hypothetical protein